MVLLATCLQVFGSIVCGFGRSFDEHDTVRLRIAYRFHTPHFIPRAARVLLSGTWR